MNNQKPHIILLLGVFLLTGCSYFSTEKSATYAARVDNVYLSRKEIEKALPEDLSAEDSIIFVHNYIHRWALQQLLMEGAKRNLPEEKQEVFNQMAKNYHRELYTEAYKNLIIAHKMDTLVTNAEMKAFYRQHKSNFKLHENLVKLRFIKINKNNPDSLKIKKRLKRFTKEDRFKLQQASYKFELAALDDSVWVRTRKLYQKIPVLNPKKEDEFLKKGKFVDRSDSISVYLIFFKAIRLRHQQAPYKYIKPVLKQIIRNRRKVKFAKKFEKDITRDALDDNKFEIYQ